MTGRARGIRQMAELLEGGGELIDAEEFGRRLGRVLREFPGGLHFDLAAATWSAESELELRVVPGCPGVVEVVVGSVSPVVVGRISVLRDGEVDDG